MMKPVINASLIFIFFMLLAGNSRSEDDYLCTIKIHNNLRSAPSPHAARVIQLNKYTPLKIIENLGEWIHVKGPNYQGYIYHTLVSHELTCMTLINHLTPYCPQKQNSKLRREIKKNEGFKILKQDIGCNYVQEKWGQKLWISSTNIWPRHYAKLIQIKK